MLSLKPCFVFLQSPTSLYLIKGRNLQRDVFPGILLDDLETWQRWSAFTASGKRVSLRNQRGHLHYESHRSITLQSNFGGLMFFRKVIRHRRQPHRFHDLLLKKGSQSISNVMLGQFHEPSPKKKHLLHGGSTEAPGPIKMAEFWDFWKPPGLDFDRKIRIILMETSMDPDS